MDRYGVQEGINVRQVLLTEDRSRGVSSIEKQARVRERKTVRN